MFKTDHALVVLRVFIRFLEKVSRDHEKKAQKVASERLRTRVRKDTEVERMEQKIKEVQESYDAQILELADEEAENTKEVEKAKKYQKKLESFLDD